MSEFDNYSPRYQPTVNSNTFTHIAPQEDGTIQKVIRGVQGIKLSESCAPAFELHKDPTGKYEGLRDAELFLLKDFVDLNKKTREKLAEDMGLAENEILVVARRSGRQHLAKVDRKVLTQVNQTPDALAKDSRKKVDTLGVRAQFDEVFKKA